MSADNKKSISLKIYSFCDKAICFCFCALIYFLPISIALVEIFSALAVLFYLGKRVSGLVSDIKIGKTKWPESSWGKKILIALKALRPIKNALNVPILILLITMVLSVVFSQSPAESVKGFFGKFLQSVLIFITFIEGINSKKRLRIFLICFFVSAVVVCANGIFQFFTDAGFIFSHPKNAGRLMSCLRQANDFAAYLIVIIPALMSVSLLLGKEVANKVEKEWDLMFLYKKTTKTIVLLLTICALGCLGLTYSRGAWIAFALSMVFLGLRSKKMLAISLLLVFIFLAIFFPKLMTTRDQFTDLQSLVDNNNRLIYWPASIHLIKENPIVGVGLNAYSNVAKETDFDWQGYPHNGYLHMTAETGYLGLGAFLWMIFILFKNAFSAMKRIEFKSLRYILFGFLGSLVAFLLHGGVDTIFYSVQLSALQWILIALIISVEQIGVPKLEKRF